MYSWILPKVKQWRKRMAEESSDEGWKRGAQEAREDSFWKED